jgi:hypothetical protein
MRMTIGILSILASITVSIPEARAQETRTSVFVAPSGISDERDTRSAYQIGGGIERLLERGIGASVDAAAVLPGQGKFKDTVGLLAIDLNYHLKGVRTEPFVAGGYSLLFRDFTANMINFGGGINYWFAPSHGLRLEFRDNVGTVMNGPTTHYWGFRIGMNFR